MRIQYRSFVKCHESFILSQRAHAFLKLPTGLYRKSQILHVQTEKSQKIKKLKVDHLCMTTQATVVPRFICGVHTCEEKSRIYSVYIFYRRNNNNFFFLTGKLHSLGVIFREVLCIIYIIVIKK